MQSSRRSASSTKKKAIVSACLLGELCRYDAQTKKDAFVCEALKEYEVIAFCPEAPLFGTPRERIDVVETQEGRRIVTHETNVDVTEMLQEEILRFIKQNPHADLVILKSKSPSCGVGTTPVLNENKERIGMGNGLAAELFLKHYPKDIIFDEHEFRSRLSR